MVEELSMSEERVDCPYCEQPAGSACVVVRSRRVGLTGQRAGAPHSLRVDQWVVWVNAKVRAAQARPTEEGTER